MSIGTYEGSYGACSDNRNGLPASDCWGMNLAWVLWLHRFRSYDGGRGLALTLVNACTGCREFADEHGWLGVCASCGLNAMARRGYVL